MKFCSEVCCILTHFHYNLGSRGGKYSGLTSAEIRKKHRELMTEAKKEKERIRKQRWRQNLKENHPKYNKYLENERLGKNYTNLMKSQKSLASSSSNSLTPKASRTSEEVSRETTRPVLQNESTFSTKQSRSRSLKKAADHLPQSPRKKVEIIQSLASKYQIRIKMHENRGRPRKELSEEKEH